MAIVVKWLTQRIVAPSLVGSNPISRPIRKKKVSLQRLFLFCAGPVSAAMALPLAAGAPTIKKACTVTVHA